MKKLKLWLVILPVFTIGCSDEYTNQKIETSQATRSFKTSDLTTQKSVDPFDRAGEIYNNILDTLDRSSFNPHSIAEVVRLVDSVSKQYSELDLLSTETILSKRLSEIKWILNHKDASNDAVINKMLTRATIREDARKSFSLFVKSLMPRADDPYENVRLMILSYEKYVMDNTEFNSDEKRILLTTTSVVGYSVDRKRKDKDWETSITKIAATVSGANQDIVLSLKMALTVGICQKKNITQ